MLMDVSGVGFPHSKSEDTKAKHTSIKTIYKDNENEKYM
jgi:hypothetical protein